MLWMLTFDVADMYVGCCVEEENTQHVLQHGSLYFDLTADG
jgi:hypothetical protein